jgi:thiamine-monophosphate kinase
MGATPIAITVGLSLRQDVTLDWIETVYQGMKQCLDQFATPIIGGDITRSQTNTISITALGQVAPHQTILRHVAQPHDLIVITGKHGLAKAGLELLLNPNLYQSIASIIQNPLIKAHQYPQPRFDVINSLQKLNFLKPIAGMDSSDGLADAIMQICRFSQVGAKINLESIPIDKNILELTDSNTALDWCLYGGEDFELVLCLPPTLANQLLCDLKHEAFIIGEITKSTNIKISSTQSSNFQLLLHERKTYQHFQLY